MSKASLARQIALDFAGTQSPIVPLSRPGSENSLDPALIVTSEAQVLNTFLQPAATQPYLLLEGDALHRLSQLPSEAVDTVITSPPYWGQREYGVTHSRGTEIGGEATLDYYIQVLARVFQEIKRVLKPTGSLWLNIGDSYADKKLLSIPWRLAIHLQDAQGWVLRNDVVWNKMKGAPDNSKDKLRNAHEFVFHFVQQKKYYYDVDAIRNTAKSSTVRDGVVLTATGVSGINYRRQIARSPDLSDAEKANALATLEATLQKVARGELSDFRMIIRGRQRATHSESPNVSGRAAELLKKGFCILPYDPAGSKPGDVWDIVPEDTWRTDSHCAPFPLQLCILPIKATCPPGGIVLDPFVGTGTVPLAAQRLQRRAIGIDLYPEYLELARQRLAAG